LGRNGLDANAASSDLEWFSLRAAALGYVLGMQDAAAAGHTRSANRYRLFRRNGRTSSVALWIRPHNPRTEALLRGLLKDRARSVRSAAANAIAEGRHDKLSVDLQATVRGDSMLSVRESALDALIKLGDEVAHETVMQLIPDPKAALPAAHQSDRCASEMGHDAAHRQRAWAALHQAVKREEEALGFRAYVSMSQASRPRPSPRGSTQNTRERLSVHRDATRIGGANETANVTRQRTTKRGRTKEAARGHEAVRWTDLRGRVRARESPA